MNAAPSKEDRVSAKDRYDENYFSPYSRLLLKQTHCGKYCRLVTCRELSMPDMK
jgi:hypothetical protein